MKTSLVTVFSLLVIALVACGGSSSGDGSNTDSNGTAPAGSCAAAGTRLCQRACACSTDGKCHVASPIDGGTAVTINFDNEQKCKDLYVTFGCVGGGETTLDYGACDSAIAASSCVAGAGGTGILFPEVCKSKK